MLFCPEMALTEPITRIVRRVSEKVKPASQRCLKYPQEPFSCVGQFTTKGGRPETERWRVAMMVCLSPEHIRALQFQSRD